MKRRNAVERANEITADCPVDGTCLTRQAGRKVIWLPCGYFEGKEKSRKGLKVKCSYDP